MSNYLDMKTTTQEEKKMSQTQKDALSKMGNAGAVRAGSAWIWREDVRQSEEAARKVMETDRQGKGG